MSDFEVATSTIYEEMIKRLITMDEKQLIELFHDIVSCSNIEQIEAIADTAYYYVENYAREEETAPNEHFEADCAMRGRDLADEQKRNY